MSQLEADIRQLCRQCGLRMNTDLGQHFLIDEEVLGKIVESGNIQKDDHIVEIGPGIGALTKELVAHAGKVTAIELDARMVPILLIYTQQPRNLTVIKENALHAEYPAEPYKVIANIPYHITSPLLKKLFLESARAPETLTLLIQREVAEKICDEKDAGMLTILVRLFGKPKLVTLVPPKSFLPPPKVDSAVLHIDCYKEPIADAATIEKIFKYAGIAFGQKRKMLRNTLGAFPEVAEQLEALGIDQKRRPQTLTIDEWVALAKAMGEH